MAGTQILRPSSTGHHPCHQGAGSERIARIQIGLLNPLHHNAHLLPILINFIYLRVREIQSPCLLVHSPKMPTVAGAEPSQNWKPQVPCRSHTWVSGTQLLGPSPVAPQDGHEQEVNIENRARILT